MALVAVAGATVVLAARAEVEPVEPRRRSFWVLALRSTLRARASHCSPGLGVLRALAAPLASKAHPVNRSRNFSFRDSIGDQP